MPPLAIIVVTSIPPGAPSTVEPNIRGTMRWLLLFCSLAVILRVAALALSVIPRQS